MIFKEGDIVISMTWGVHESSLSPAHLETILEEFNTLLP